MSYFHHNELQSIQPHSRQNKHHLHHTPHDNLYYIQLYNLPFRQDTQLKMNKRLNDIIINKMFACLFSCLCVFLFVFLFVCLYVCLFACLITCLLAYLFVLDVCLIVRLFDCCLFVFLLE